MEEIKEKEDLKHILVDESIRKELKIMAVKQEITIGEVVKKLLKEKIGGNI